MTSTKKIPPIVQIGAWVLALFVFAVGFWHTHLGLKEMKPFGSEWGGLVIAGIVLMLLLITYWFAVNGRKMALVFYILCGVIFFVCNLNYFYPAYMARTLIQNEAKALIDTLDHYSNGTTKIDASENAEAYADWSKLTSLKSDIVSEIKSKGYGPNAKGLTNQFNSILARYKISQIPVDPSYGKVTSNQEDILSQLNEIEPKIDKAIGDFIGYGILKLIDPDLFTKGKKDLDNLKDTYKDRLTEISTDNQTEYHLDSITKYGNVKTIVSFVNDLNGSIDQINKGNNAAKPLLKNLDQDVHPRADKLGMIKYTILSIKERIKEIDTWAIIILCLFIDLLVPLAIYLLLRKKEDEPDNKSLQGKLKPTTF